MREERFVKAWEDNAPSAFGEHEIDVSKVFFFYSCFWKNRIIATTRNTWNQWKVELYVYLVLKKNVFSTQMLCSKRYRHISYVTVLLSFTKSKQNPQNCLSDTIQTHLTRSVEHSTQMYRCFLYEKLLYQIFKTWQINFMCLKVF